MPWCMLLVHFIPDFFFPFPSVSHMGFYSFFKATWCSLNKARGREGCAKRNLPGGDSPVSVALGKSNGLYVCPSSTACLGMGLFRLLQPGRAEAPAGGGGHAATPQIWCPVPAPSQTAQDGRGHPRSDQCQAQSIPGCRRQGNDHQEPICESRAGAGDLEVVFTWFFFPGGALWRLPRVLWTCLSVTSSHLPGQGWWARFISQPT